MAQNPGKGAPWTPKSPRRWTASRNPPRQLLTSAGALTDAQAAAASRLPGWTRGHVLTHLARNADGFVNLLTWARTGVKTPMYPSEAARDAGIEAGHGRRAAELTADLRGSSAAFAAAAAGLTAADWAAQVERRGDSFPAREILARRWAELEFHHVDLDARLSGRRLAFGLGRAGTAAGGGILRGPARHAAVPALPRRLGGPADGRPGQPAHPRRGRARRAVGAAGLAVRPVGGQRSPGHRGGGRPGAATAA